MSTVHKANQEYLNKNKKELLLCSGFIRDNYLREDQKQQRWVIALTYLILIYFPKFEKLSIRYYSDMSPDPHVYIQNDNQFIVRNNVPHTLFFGWRTIWGNRIISKEINKIYEWDIALESSNEFIAFRIGISNSLSSELQKCLIFESFIKDRSDDIKWNEHYFYGISNNGEKIRKINGKMEEDNFNYNPELKLNINTWKYNTKIKMNLSVQKQTGKLKFYINDVYKKFANFNNITFPNFDNDKQNYYNLIMSTTLNANIKIVLVNFSEYCLCCKK